MCEKQTLVALTGPTAAGKTALSLALAKALDGEIISADSMQVYRHMDIGTAKITAAEMQGVPHHLIDILEPEENFDAMRFQKLAKQAIEEIQARGKVPILVGGTGFYLQTVLYEVPFSEESRDEAVHAALTERRAREGIASAQPHRWLGAGGTPTTDEEYTGAITLSPSQFERALACPLRWFLTTIGADAPSNAAASLGTLIHAVAEEHPHGTPEELTEALEARIEELGYNLDTWAGRVADRHARDIVNNLASYVIGVPGEVTVEQTVSAEVEGVTIRGRMDRLEHVDEGVRVTDLKTGKSGYSAKTVPDNPQLAAYQMAMLASGERVAGARIALLGGDKPKYFDQPRLEGQVLEEWHDKLRSVSADARGPYFEARPSDAACAYCSFERLCPARERGRKVVE